MNIPLLIEKLYQQIPNIYSDCRDSGWWLTFPACSDPAMKGRGQQLVEIMWENYTAGYHSRPLHSVPRIPDQMPVVEY